MPKNIMSYTFWNGQSLSATVHSRPISMNLLDNAGLTLNTSGVTTNTGTFIVEGTNDNPFDMAGAEKSSGTTWFTVSISPAMTLANADATFEPNLNQFPWAYMRVSFTPGGGSPNGTVTGKFYGKGL